ncbi:uncharacterized protein NECHADRAFT_83491 [Fusarium vanettenii 77-13-4]|uniref:D-lactate dehydratase n=1 Tax=Fusarium vanettenii (strain ATCC MYA-4622 / CBS 123669 / FGSC 9596 / NRRL 45880 / 77-13-4) TaxID=660122 RepID=C7Z460_FUSV7|nr:uncharacterized protein NECHADRAFT_83491 [Fusarium vanettenii 77-13-4]EEU41423.1 hypothetical protein NECHADRAFT_83491 [Fusarium vanettenii 77-13-4]
MAASKPRILVVLTSTDKVPTNGKPIGWYLSELAHPFHVLHGKADFTFASPMGGEAPLDQVSVEMSMEDPVCKDFHDNHSSTWRETRRLSEVADRTSEFDAVFYPGGHGPMFDLISNPDSLRILRDLHAEDKVIAAVCHGPAALVNAKTADGEYIIQGREVTGFDDVGEEMFGFDEDVGFSLEGLLNERSGGKYSKADDGPLGKKVIVDGKLITGQNPASAYDVGLELAKALGV